MPGMMPASKEKNKCDVADFCFLSPVYLTRVHVLLLQADTSTQTLVQRVIGGEGLME